VAAKGEVPKNNCNTERAINGEKEKYFYKTFINTLNDSKHGWLL